MSEVDCDRVADRPIRRTQTTSYRTKLSTYISRRTVAVQTQWAPQSRTVDTCCWQSLFSSSSIRCLDCWLYSPQVRQRTCRLQPCPCFFISTLCLRKRRPIIMPRHEAEDKMQCCDHSVCLFHSLDGCNFHRRGHTASPHDTVFPE